MTIDQLLAALRTQLTDAAKPGLAGVRALEAAGATLTQLEDEVDLMRQRWADKEAVRLGHILRHACTPEQYYEATQRARAEHPLPEGWVLLRRDDRWQASDGFHATMLHITREGAIEAAWDAVRLWGAAET